MRSYKFINYSFMITILLFHVNVLAIFDNSNGDNSISIVSNSEAILDLKQGIADYSGNVTVKHGKSLLTADRVRIYQVSKKINRIIADGNTKVAHLTLVNDSFKTPLVGSGYNIDCDLVTQTIKIQGKAEVKFQKHIIRSKIINYNHKNSSITAKTNQKQIKNSSSKIETIIDFANN